MESACLRHTELPSASKLFTDFLYHYDRVATFYEGGPREQVYPFERRSALVSALREDNPNNPSLDLLANEGTRAVVTGQQVGLFSGPAYTIFKALTAVRQARELTASGTPAVPVFWLATEDHDFAEVSRTWSFDTEAQPVELAIAENSEEGRPVGGIVPSAWPLEELRRSLEPFPFGGEIYEHVEASYTPGASMGSAFHALLQRLLGPYGLIFLDPMKPAVRSIAAPLLKEVLLRDGDLIKRLLERNHELADRGYHAQVHIEAKTSLVFLLDGGKRVVLRKQEGGYLSKDRRYTATELANRAHELSPNAVLRPVVQDYLLPTSMYIGGPAELAYFAQSQTLYEGLGQHMPRVMSRSGFTLFDARSKKLMQKYKLRLPDFFHGEQPLREKLAQALIPESLQAEFEQAKGETVAMLDRLEVSVSQFDPTLGKALSNSRAKILHQLGKIHAKVARETLRRETRASADAAYLTGMLFPHKHLQERFYTILPLLAKHGPSLIETIYNNVHLDCPDHILLTV